MATDYSCYVGIDWATQSHQVCVIDGERQLLVERSVDHTGLALTQFVDWLGELTGNLRWSSNAGHNPLAA